MKTIQERVDEINGFIEDQNYRVEQWIGKPEMKFIASDNEEWDKRYRFMYTEFHEARRLTRRITWMEHEKAWWVQGKGYTNIAKVLDTEIKVYAISLVNLS